MSSEESPSPPTDGKSSSSAPSLSATALARDTRYRITGDESDETRCSEDSRVVWDELSNESSPSSFISDNLLSSTKMSTSSAVQESTGSTDVHKAIQGMFDTPSPSEFSDCSSTGERPVRLFDPRIGRLKEFLRGSSSEESSPASETSAESRRSLSSLRKEDSSSFSNSQTKSSCSGISEGRSSTSSWGGSKPNSISSSLGSSGSSKSEGSSETGNSGRPATPYPLRSKGPLLPNVDQQVSFKKTKLRGFDVVKPLGNQPSKPSARVLMPSKDKSSDVEGFSDLVSTKTPVNIVTAPKTKSSEFKASSKTLSRRMQMSKEKFNLGQSPETSSETPTKTVSEPNLSSTPRRNRETASPYMLRPLLPVSYYGSPGSVSDSEQYNRPRTTKKKLFQATEEKGNKAKERSAKTKEVDQKGDNMDKDLSDAMEKLSIFD